MLLLAIVLVAVLLLLTVNFYTDWLWFENLGFSSVFWTYFSFQWGSRLAAGGFSFIFLFVNLLLVRSFILHRSQSQETVEPSLSTIFNKKKITVIFTAISIIMAFLFAVYAGYLWPVFLKFLYPSTFGIADPLFGLDAGFYIFRLPLLKFLLNFVQATIIHTLIICGILYFIANPSPQVGKRGFLPNKGIAHLSLLLSSIFILAALGYRLRMYDLLFSTDGFIYGPGYTDVYARLPAYWILILISLLLALLMIINSFKRKLNLLIGSVGIIVVASIIVAGILPSFIQRLRVEPNELAFEQPYIANNIEFTRRAFGLDNVSTRNFPAGETLSWADLVQAKGTITNIRLWDYRPLLQTFNQLQAIRQYYEFVTVDTDRYYIDGEYRQVMLSGRELNTTRLASEAQTWTNLRLQFTHGYGATMNTVAEVTSDGLPRLVVKDIPAQTEGLPPLLRPEIYYGHLTSDYVVVNTHTQEFSYPMGDTNVYLHYEGTGGVQLSTFFRRLLFSLRFQDYRLFLSGEIHNESRIMFYRNIKERVERIAPFLQYDRDPYLVLHEGRLWWIYDAYTTSANYPYSQPFEGINYIRNSVKVLIDAYNGNMYFYVMDFEDPVIQTFMKAFPDLFLSIQEMPDQLRDHHLRYPKDLFALQTKVYATYHMQNPTVFYNREDLWQTPNEKYAGTVQPVEPYYNIVQLPEGEKEEFIIMFPFTPSRRDNMIAWLAGRCDGEHYGELIVYHFPKDRVVYGPMQVEVRIDQNPLISQQLTLWEHRGTGVIRGNLLVLPINNSILYVEPVFLQASQSELPELARVIVAFNNTVVMERTIEDALSLIFDVQAGDGWLRQATPDGTPSTLAEIIQSAQQLFEKSKQSIMQGNWAEYADCWAELEQILEKLVEACNEP